MKLTCAIAIAMAIPMTRNRDLSGASSLFGCLRPARRAVIGVNDSA